MSDQLSHVGILGMRWGFRKGNSSSGGKPVFMPKKKPTVKDISDEDLKKIIARLQLEKQYRELNPQKVSAGKKFLMEALKTFGTEAAKTYISNAAKDSGNELYKVVNAAIAAKKK